MSTMAERDAIRQEMAQAAKNALNAYAEGYGSYKAFKRAEKMLKDYDADRS